MKKGLISLLSGTILGVLISFLALDYKGYNYERLQKGRNGLSPMEYRAKAA
ncbi:hypothetical protein [Alkalihalobacillus sp. TS-13]|uniref:hypothetical protein n=1 Tax=Alkalihalobacillus sp. TS-13 TaxID=2842455 RepID=UPI001C883DBB|nr:hypothetical protein [Alkalihalobacillus sp. TS-13]